MLGTIPLPAPPPLPPVGAPPLLPVTPLPVLFVAEETPLDDAAATAAEVLPLTPDDVAPLLLLALTLLLLLLLLFTTPLTPPTPLLPPADCDTTFDVALFAELLFELLLLALLLAREEGLLTFVLLVNAPKVDEIILFVTALLELTPVETEFTDVPLLLLMALLDDTLKRKCEKEEHMSFHSLFS